MTLVLQVGRPKKAAKFVTATRYPRWVLGVKPRTVMSSIIRWRNGLMAVFVITNSCL